MPKSTRPKGTKITTPFGVAGFSALLRPSTKFNPDGEFNAKVILDDADPETAPFIELLTGLYEKAYEANLAEARIKQPKLTGIKRAEPPFKRVVDPDTGEELPQWSVNARSKAAFRNKDTNEVRLNTPPVVLDSKSRPVFTEPGSGSIIRFQAIANSFFTAGLGSGLQLRLIGVQVKELVPFGGAKAEFDEVDGFVETAQAPALASQPTQAARNTPATADGNGISTDSEDNAEWV